MRNHANPRSTSSNNDHFRKIHREAAMAQFFLTGFSCTRAPFPLSTSYESKKHNYRGSLIGLELLLMIVNSACSRRHVTHRGKVESLRDRLTKKKAKVACLMDESTAMKREIETCHQSAKTAAREKIALEEEFNHKRNGVQKIRDRVRRLERQVGDINEQTMRNTQAEQSETEEKLRYLEQEIEKAETLLSRLKEEENSLLEKASAGRREMEHIEDMKEREEMEEKEAFLEKLQMCLKEAELKANKLNASFENLRESAKGEIDAFEEAENELKKIEKDLQSAEAEKIHYENIMKNKVLPDINEAEANYEELKTKRKESDQKASEICPESEILSLGPWDGSTPEQLSAQINRMNQRLHRENQQFSESIDDLRMMYEKLERKIAKKRKLYQGYREKLMACKTALDSRWGKFQRNASLLRRQLTWQFNSHLGKKGISGHIKVSYENKTLSIEVKMPQDATSNAVRDTKGLSGAASFST
ncbi:hypothetical protein F2Q68_00036886 [Brassica cretica]|uniref:Uncharacterized protein n=1 Tax=Brassica cretica TaxID=69181 RepID=A0A8S9H722_BRACR|nr:hypothetical protein F2Q68_00036886 [Brassica cretica]